MTITPEAFLADPAHAVGEESDPFTELERRVCALEDLVTGRAPLSPSIRITMPEVSGGPIDFTALKPPTPELLAREDEHAAQLIDTSHELIDTSHELADLEAKHDVVLQLVERIAGIVKKSTSKVSLEVKAAIDAWANPQTPSPAPEPPHSEPQPEPIPAASTEASAGEGQPIIVGPTHDAPVEEWRAYARLLGYQGADVDTMNRSQIRTMLGIEQPVGA